MTTYTGTLNALITDNYTTLQTLKESDNAVSHLFYSEHEHKTIGWIKVGTAEITVTIDDEKDIVAGMVDAIDEQIKQTYAEAESKINLLKEKKQSLLAITMESSSS